MVALMVLGLMGVVVFGVLNVYLQFELRQRLKKVDSREFYRLGLDIGTELLGPNFGTKEVQDFIFRKLYKSHPDPVVVQLGDKVYRSAVLASACMISMVSGMLYLLWLRS